jgi:uncharacterized membrane protein YfcA
MLPSTLPTVMKQLRKIGWKRGGWGFNVALPLCVLSFIGGFFGKPLGKAIAEYFSSRKPQQCIYFFLLLWIFYSTLSTSKKHKKQPLTADAENKHAPSAKPVLTAVAGFFTGVLSSLLGIGGGTIVRPVLRGVLRVPEEHTAMIARLGVLITATAGSISYLAEIKSFSPQDPAVNSLIFAGLMAVGGMIGFPLGAAMHKQVVLAGGGDTAHESFALVILLVMVGIYCKISGLDNLGKIALVGCGIFLALYLTFTYLSAKRKIRESSWGTTSPENE